MNKLKFFLLLSLFLLLIGGAFFLIKSKKQALNKISSPQKRAIPLTTVKVSKGFLEIREHYLGTIVPLKSAQISTKLSGYILKITKYEGDKVKKGELLIEIEARSLKNKLKSLKASLKAAEENLLTKKAIFERNKKLLRYEAISKEAFDISKSAFELAKAKVIEIRQQIASIKSDLTYAYIHAPFSGLITRRFKNPGDLAIPGAPILTLEDPKSGYRILVKIPQEKVKSFSSGKTAYLILNGQEKKAKIFRTHPAVDTNALATVEIRTFKCPFNLPSNASIGVDLVPNCPKGFILPLRSLVQGKKQAVYVVRQKRLVLVPIKVKGRSKDKIVVSGALSPKDMVVVGDPGLLLRLHPGQKVALEGI